MSSANANRHRTLLVGAASFLASTGVGLVVGFILAGMLARHFSPEEFGLWGILISLNGIFLNGFDWGFGNALRNRLAQLHVHGKEDEARDHFRAVFVWFLLSAALISAILWFVKPFVPWALLFRSGDGALVGQGASLFVVGSCFFAFNVAFNLYAAGFFGYQESHWNAFFNAFSRLLLLAVVVGLVLLDGAFYTINLLSFAAILLASVVAFAVFVRRRTWRLSGRLWDGMMPVVRALWRQSAQFALLQISSTILLSADLFVLSKVLGLESVGEYFLVKRLYLTLAMLHLAMLMPVWSAYTASVESKDVAWAAKMLWRSALVTVVFFLAGCVFIVWAGDYIVLLWAGKRIGNPSLYVGLGVWCLLYGWNNCFSVFLNAIGRLRSQVIFVGLGTVLFVPVALVLGERSGVDGVCVALIAVCIPVAVSNCRQSVLAIRELSLSARQGKGSPDGPNRGDQAQGQHPHSDLQPGPLPQ